MEPDKLMHAVEVMRLKQQIDAAVCSADAQYVAAVLGRVAEARHLVEELRENIGRLMTGNPEVVELVSILHIGRRHREQKRPPNGPARMQTRGSGRRWSLLSHARRVRMQMARHNR